VLLILNLGAQELVILAVIFGVPVAVLIASMVIRRGKKEDDRGD
jgi:hypothetical protein